MIALVVVAYNRPVETERLLLSLSNANYLEEKVKLVISIDKGEKQKEIVRIAKEFLWPFGPKEIKVYSERQGLRKHILQCGALTNENEAVVVLEDDITVAEGFYTFVKQCIEWYSYDSRIAGISLYNYAINEFSHRPFEPAQTKYDAYLMQVAQSWGQCWTQRMWNDFTSWPHWNDEELHSASGIPEAIQRWRSTSWKKNYMKYLVDTNRYFVYPYISLSTNHMAAGQHAKHSQSGFQVALLEGALDYRLPNFEESVRYDVFFERIGVVWDDTLVEGKQVCFDLYGLKRDFSGFDYVLSINQLPFHVVRTFALKYRPHEHNYLKPENGTGIYLYDLHAPSKKPVKSNRFEIISFDNRCLTWYDSLWYGYAKVVRGLVRKIINLVSFR